MEERPTHDRDASPKESSGKQAETRPPSPSVAAESPLAGELPAWDLRPPHTIVVRRPRKGPRAS